MLVCRKQFMHMQQFFQVLQYLPAKYSIDIIAGDFNYNLSKVSQNTFLETLRPCQDGKSHIDL